MTGASNIYLIGMMGAGKTTVGRLLARRLKLRFFDSDHEVERRCGVKIPIIFEIEGERGFRARESQALAELTALEGIVLATGGGAVLSRENRDNLARRGTVVYLRASPEDLFVRVRHDRNRPLLATPDPLARLRKVSRYLDDSALARTYADIAARFGETSPIPRYMQGFYAKYQDRLLYATDASIYEMEPVAVVFPRSAADVSHVVETLGISTGVVPGTSRTAAHTAAAEITQRRRSFIDG